MGRDLGTKMKIVDFFGLPGSGKSTIAQLAALSLREKGYIVDDYPIYIGNKASTAMRMLVKIKSTIVFSLLHFKFLYGLFKSLGESPFQSFSEAVKQWINICYVITMYNRAVRQKKYRIFDQGLAQTAISLTANCKQTTADFVLNELLKMVNISPDFVYIQANANTALIRLKSRKCSRSRVQQYTNNDEDKKKMLIKIELSCENIKKHSPINLISFQNDKNSQAEEIAQSIVNKCLLMMEENNAHKRTGIHYYSNP
ncbi:hypothetical protein QNH20_21490 [Neobacillus sp. WH10]|uniref:hypothetical protein n=1 Tax=Neobacillus sp. WH10 TaxID=3047873 RepID=UPI0024C1D005|nr:hypothetical protein [Neobacillus sp. WH10]WHY76639.1 hypothetical protein QNH20_21490 [Neobacillus sp. WH10]